MLGRNIPHGWLFGKSVYLLLSTMERQLDLPKDVRLLSYLSSSEKEVAKKIAYQIHEDVNISVISQLSNYS